MEQNNEKIYLTDLDQRLFPEITENEKELFIKFTNNFELSNRAITDEQIKSVVMMPQNADPLISGQIRSIEYILNLAKNPDLIPKPHLITENNFNKDFAWLFNIHGNLLYELYLKGEKLLNSIDYPTREEIGKLRTEDKFLGHRKMPPPELLKSLLIESFIKYSKVYHKYHDILSTPQMMEAEDWERLSSAIYKVNLDICCIKPFKDGSNRTARIVENLLRLNTGLKFKIIQDKNKYLKDIWNHQDEYFKYRKSVE